MKPVVIIAIAVVCSIAGTIGVLVAWQGVATIQAQQAYDEYERTKTILQDYEKELEEIAHGVNREVCVELFGNSMSMAGESNRYADCLEYGAKSQVEYSITDCYQYSAGLIFDQCQLKLQVEYYDSIIPKLDELTEEQRVFFGFGSEDMIEMRNDWNVKANLLNLNYENIQRLYDERKTANMEGMDLIELSDPVNFESELKPELTLDSIKSDYLECKKNEQYGTGCKDNLKENMDEYCRITTSSHSEYDICFGEITKIQ